MSVNKQLLIGVGAIVGGVLGGVVGGGVGFKVGAGVGAKVGAGLGGLGGLVIAIFAEEIKLKFSNPKTGQATLINYKKGDNFLNVRYDQSDQIQPQYKFPKSKLPKWEKIKISQLDKQVLQCLMKDEFIQEYQQFKCPISQQLMREPVTLECCLNKYCCEKSVAKDWFSKGKTTCPIPNCSKQSHPRNIIQQSQLINGVKKAIKDIRKRLLLTFQKQELSDQFQKVINKAFGEGYFMQHLQNN